MISLDNILQNHAETRKFRKNKKEYKTAYNTTSKNYGKSLTNITDKGNNASKAVSEKNAGLDKSTVNKIKSYIKKRKEIPEDLMALLTPGSAVFKACAEYNEAVIENTSI